MSPASEKLADQFTVIPYPFVGEHRDAIEAEYVALLNGGISPTEVADLIIHALEILLNKRKKLKERTLMMKLRLKCLICLGALWFLKKCSQIKNIKN